MSPDAERLGADGQTALMCQALLNAPCGAVVASATRDGTIDFVNHAFTAITGYERADVPTISAWLERAYPEPDYRAMVVANWQRDVSEPGRQVVYAITTKDGVNKEVSLSASRLSSDRMVVTLLDVTESRATERQLRESEERYRTLLDSLPVGLAIHTQGRVRFANAAALRIIGAPRLEPLLGRPILDFVHPAYHDEVRKRTGKLYAKQGVADWFKLQFLQLDGTPVHVESAASPVSWQGEPAGQVVIADVEARTAAEAERRALDEREQRTQKLESLSVLAAGVAHDLNNLLVGVLGNADVALLELPADASVRQRVEGIQLAARRAAELARQMLAYSGRGILRTQTLDLAELVREMTELVAATLSKKVVLQYRFGEGVPAVEVDATQLRQVVLNLLTNAAEAMGDEGGTITVETGAVECDKHCLADTYVASELAPGRYVYLDVVDSGPGIAPAIVARVFDPFFSTKFVGRGLGLAAVLGIVKAHHGTIAVHSEPGRGTRFRILLPAALVAAESRQRPQAVPSSAPAHATVLLADDERMVRDVATEMLQMAGFDVVVVADGHEAVVRFAERASEIDCVVLDLAMPRMDGLEALRELRQLRPDVKVVLSSGYPEPEALDQTGQDVVFVQKPYRYGALIAAVRKAMG